MSDRTPLSRGVDLVLVLGWPDRTGDLVHRTIGAAAFVVCAAPSYWAARGTPRHPLELAQQECLTIRPARNITFPLERALWPALE
ncbi:hypothetical protein JJB11_10855 [Ramlibacter ginsenosidimutans]|uniref:LysR substrate-binding domain-containing protein n=1 Tax=Ramlibacter ginsenosidimutans TaxID=502333 RepID=A0A934TTP6_9BURK|nr:LysR substrate-binding domain-containing protein [Ramlibacter ginsenosidimutans]MBK6006592.1 hypothetical protein [Ramlibacter ginsenosidimutans]